MAGTSRTCMLSATEKEAAFRRIGYFRYRRRGGEPEMDHWSILNWFVQLARKPAALREMAESELEILRQEYRALQEVSGGFNQNVVTVEALEKFQSAVRRHVEELADAGRTEFGPFTLTRVVYMPRPDDPHQSPRAQKVVSGEFVEPFQGHGLLHLMSGLFDRVGLEVRRCPQCSHVFLQGRRDAGFCDRTCQANAYARSKREAAKRITRQQIGKPQRREKQKKA